MHEVIKAMNRVFVLLLVFLFSCSKAPGGRISETGHFPSPTKSKILVVEEDAKGIISFSITQSASKKIVVSESIGSAYQRWFFYWESDSVVWVQSSDIGMLKIIEFGTDDLVSNNKVLKRGDPELGGIPKIVKEGLSKTLTRRLGL